MSWLWLTSMDLTAVRALHCEGRPPAGILIYLVRCCTRIDSRVRLHKSVASAAGECCNKA